MTVILTTWDIWSMVAAGRRWQTLFSDILISAVYAKSTSWARVQGEMPCSGIVVISSSRIPPVNMALK
jgi:hypothetical protein